MPETLQCFCSYKVCVAAGWSKSDPILSSYDAHLHSRSRPPQKGWGGPWSLPHHLSSVLWGLPSPFGIDLRQAEHLFPASIPTVRSHFCQLACFFFFLRRLYSPFLFIYDMYTLLYLFSLATLGLHCCARAFL